MNTKTRSQRLATRQSDAIATKLVNRARKEKERSRRDARMIAKLKSCSPPYAASVMSWLSGKLDKKARRITADDIKSLTA